MEDYIEVTEKKIGLLTFHRTTNFGSCLQTFGLYKKIEDLGFTCELIDYRCPAIENRENLKPVYEFFSIKDWYRRVFVQPVYDKKAREIELFTSQFMKTSSPVFQYNKGKINDRYDKFVVGSDIVWGRDITKDDYTYFLDFVTDSSKKYAFSSSVGDCILREDESILKELLSNFSHIAVRESEAVNWVKKISGIDADLVCDPTMLLSANEWDRYIYTRKIREKYVFVYFDSNGGKCLSDAKRYAKNRNLDIVYVNYGKPIKGVKSVRPTSLQDFLSWIKYADIVFTASYHGMLFSIYYNREFLFYTRAHSSRVMSLARKLGVLDHCGDYWDGNIYNNIDYDEVNSKVEAFRNYSVEKLKGMLSE